MALTRESIRPFSWRIEMPTAIWRLRATNCSMNGKDDEWPMRMVCRRFLTERLLRTADGSSVGHIDMLLWLSSI